MVQSWSNIDRFEAETLSLISDYVESRQLTVDEMMESADYTNEMLGILSEPALNALRTTDSTGTFIYFLGKDQVDPERTEAMTSRGLYYRDFSPVSSSLDYSDVLFLKGPVSIARKYNIPLDSFWNEQFEFYPENTVAWEGLMKVLKEAEENPQLNSDDLSYWVGTHIVDPKENKTNECISYMRPLIMADPEMRKVYWALQLPGSIGIPCIMKMDLITAVTDYPQHKKYFTNYGK